MDKRLQQLAALVAEECESHYPPLSARFVEEHDVSVEEYDALCDLLAEGAKAVVKQYTMRLNERAIAA